MSAQLLRSFIAYVGLSNLMQVESVNVSLVGFRHMHTIMLQSNYLTKNDSGLLLTFDAQNCFIFQLSLSRSLSLSAFLVLEAEG